MATCPSMGWITALQHGLANGSEISGSGGITVCLRTIQDHTCFSSIVPLKLRNFLCHMVCLSDSHPNSMDPIRVIDPMCSKIVACNFQDRVLSTPTKSAKRIIWNICWYDCGMSSSHPSTLFAILIMSTRRGRSPWNLVYIGSSSTPEVFQCAICTARYGTASRSDTGNVSDSVPSLKVT